ncbi:hypothetical protein JKA74_18770 [Marivirga sp. S37H4]|uniref:Uncharacterized protein n=1 Tax=Marivirga aurantiaca TaxID=2802615 RepID=A0A934X2E8_9BACT|nr:hypothetical protein [Marivirga aurantiaca]MBK6267095.1 hypothetical protein [Marivirga aurantiaca]
MKNITTFKMRQYIGNFLVGVTLIISFISHPSNFNSPNHTIIDYSFSTEWGTVDASDFNLFEFPTAKLSGNGLKAQPHSEIFEKLAVKPLTITRIFFPFPGSLAVNTFSRNVFYVFISSKAP